MDNTSRSAWGKTSHNLFNAVSSTIIELELEKEGSVFSLIVVGNVVDVGVDGPKLKREETAWKLNLRWRGLIDVTVLEILLGEVGEVGELAEGSFITAGGINVGNLPGLLKLLCRFKLDKLRKLGVFVLGDKGGDMGRPLNELAWIAKSKEFREVLDFAVLLELIEPEFINEVSVEFSVNVLETVDKDGWLLVFLTKSGLEYILLLLELNVEEVLWDPFL